MKYSGILALLVTLIASDVFAETERRDPGSAAAAKAQYMLRQVAAERDALKSQNAQLEDEKEKLKKQLESLETKTKSTEGKNNYQEKLIERYKENDQVLRTRIDQQRERMEEVIEKFQEVVASLREVETRKTQLTAQVADLDREVRACAKNNVMLFETGLEVLGQYKNKGVWEAMSQKEPVTGLTKVTIQNLVRDYRQRMKEQKYSNESISSEAAH